MKHKDNFASFMCFPASVIRSKILYVKRIMFKPVRLIFLVILIDLFGFNDATSIFKTMYCRMRNGWMVMSGPLRSLPVWKKEIMVYFRLLFQHLLGETERNHETPQACLFSSDILPSEYKTNSDSRAEHGNAVISGTKSIKNLYFQTIQSLLHFFC
jgi:hypothetical protein